MRPVSPSTKLQEPPRVSDHMPSQPPAQDTDELGAAAQAGIFLTFAGSLLLGFTSREAAAIGIIGGADGPTAIFLSAKLAPELLGAIAIAAYSYMALVPVIQPPIMRLLTTREERLIRMRPPRKVSKREKMIFPVAAFFVMGRSLGAIWVNANAKFEDAATGETTKAIPRKGGFILPTIYGMARINKWVAVGLGVYTVFGLGIEWQLYGRRRALP